MGETKSSNLPVMKLFLILLITISGCLLSQQKDIFESDRNKMVKEQIIDRGVTDIATIKAMRKVPRHLFVPKELINNAYEDRPLPIGYNQTISQPFIVAFMTEVSKPEKIKRVLEIGTGSGYQAAVLAEIVDTVYTIEIISELATEVATKLKSLGYNNIVTRQGDGYRGWPEHAPFDIIIVTAAPDHIPQPLIDQLADNGRMVIPVGAPSSVQELIFLEKKNGKVEKKD
ncbi:MAG: protein-L-isoaspartate(D-aspartate) O-methyltransferase [Desulfobacterales bacterium]|nr:protein-L-isoaspartate(D-aspartate) O-methyltransferase [Desulfobacterales bacterium]